MRRANRDDQPGRARDHPPASAPATRSHLDPRSGPLLRLQGHIGNRAVGALLRQPRRAPEPEPGIVDRVLAAGRTMADLATARQDGDWAAAARILSGLDQGSALVLLDGFSARELTTLDAAGVASLPRPEAALLHRRIAFHRRGPAAQTAHEEANVLDQGKRRDRTAVPGGTVEVRTGVHYEIPDPSFHGDFPAGVSLSYRGKEAARTRWLQFLWREVIVERPPRSPDGPPRKAWLPLTVTGNAAHKLKTTTGRQRHYVTDSRSETSPFYDVGFADNRTDDTTAMFDSPGSLSNHIAPLFAGPDPPTKVTSVAHLNTYLVRDMEVLYRVKIDVEWAFTSADKPPPWHAVRSAGRVDRLDADHRATLMAQYPGFDYLPRERGEK